MSLFHKFPILSHAFVAHIRLATAIAIACATTAGCQSTEPNIDNTANALKKQSTYTGISQKQYPDIWSRIRDGYQLQDQAIAHQRVVQQKAWLTKNPAIVQKASMASSPYIHYVVEELDKRGMPLELALLPVIESSYNPKAYSRSKAVGLWQFMSATGQDFDLDQTRWYDGRKDVVASTDAAINYLSYLHTMFNDDWLLALAAYNAGEGRVSNAIEHNHRLGLPTDYWDLPLPTETKNYVPKLLAVSEIIKNNQMYGIHLASIADKPYFVMIPTKQQLNLKTVAKTTSTTSDELMKLNPGYKHSIMKDGPSRLLVPVQKAKSVQASLAAMPSSSYASSASTYTSNSTYRPTTYTVHKGDTVHSISQRYNININDLKLLNHIASNNVISLGQTIKIPAQPSQGSQLSYRDKKRQAYALKKRQELAMYSNKSNTAQHSSIVYYKVKQGDSIPAIADRLNISMNDLRVINPQKYSALTPGQTLKLRVPE